MPSKNPQRDYLVTGVNAIKMIKENKDKTKDLSHIKFYTCKQIGHYANRYLKKPKN